MRLVSRDGVLVEIRPVRYQFPSAGRPGGDWDANWLVISGHVQIGDGRCWDFEDPCLTTWEARSLSAWLQAVGSGMVEPVPADGDMDEGMLAFTEPNLAFSLAARDTDTATVRVHLSLEASPPWLAGTQVDLFDFYVQIHTTAAELTYAAAEWDDQLRSFPAV